MHMNLNEKIVKIDKKIVIHEKLSSFDRLVLITEAFDKNTADSAIALIKRLNAIRWPTSPTSVSDPFIIFRKATKEAIAQLQKVLSGKKDVFTSLINLFKSDTYNPFVDVIAYANMLFSFFTTLYKFIEALNGDDEQTLEEIVGVDNVENLKSIITKGIKPSGLVAKLKSNWYDKYLKGFNANDFVSGIMKMTKGDLWDATKQVIEQLKNIEDITQKTVAAEEAAARGMNVTGSKEASASKPSEKSDVSSQQTASTKPKSPEVKPGRETVDSTIQRNALNKVKPTLQDAGIKNPENLISMLYDLGVIKDPND